MLTFLDPPRPDTKQTIEDANKYGVAVKMITGTVKLTVTHTHTHTCINSVNILCYMHQILSHTLHNLTVHILTLHITHSHPRHYTFSHHPLHILTPHILTHTGDHLLIAKETAKVLALGPYIKSAEGLPMLDPVTKLKPANLSRDYGDMCLAADGFAQVN